MASDLIMNLMEQLLVKIWVIKLHLLVSAFTFEETISIPTISASSRSLFFSALHLHLRLSKSILLRSKVDFRRDFDYESFEALVKA